MFNSVMLDKFCLYRNYVAAENRRKRIKSSRKRADYRRSRLKQKKSVFKSAAVKHTQNGY